MRISTRRQLQGSEIAHHIARTTWHLRCSVIVLLKASASVIIVRANSPISYPWRHPHPPTWGDKLPYVSLCLNLSLLSEECSALVKTCLMGFRITWVSQWCKFFLQPTPLPRSSPPSTTHKDDMITYIYIRRPSDRGQESPQKNDRTWAPPPPLNKKHALKEF